MGTDDAAVEAKPAAAPYEKLATFLFGVLLLAAMLIVAVLIPNPSESQSLTFRVVLAVAASGFAIFLPGAVNIIIHPALRASGALGVLLLVYAFNPPKTVSTPVQSAPPPPTNKYNLVLKLTFSAADLRNLIPYEANVSAVVNNGISFTDPAHPDSLHTKFVQRASGGITVTLPDLSAGDKLAIFVDQGGHRWRSDEMRMPEANLEMHAIKTPPSSGGQR